MFIVFRGKEFLRKLGTAFMLIGAFISCAAAVRGGVLPASGAARRLPVYSVETDKKAVSLGINCAWGDEDIPEFLAILDEHGIKATFFVLGEWALKYPEATRSIAAAGHEVQSHSHSHPDMPKLTREQIAADLTRANDAIAEVTGTRPTLFRPPSGAYDNKLIEVAEELGLMTVQWDVDSIDWRDPTPAEMTRRVLGKLSPGSITLFHAGAKNTPEALRSILPAARAEGYEFVMVSDLIYTDNYRVDHTGRQHRVG